MVVDPKPAITHVQGEVQVTLNGGEPTHVEKCGDEVAEKFQSNLEIAGSPRNSFRASLKCKSLGGRALIGLPHRITEFSQTPNANDLSLGVRLRVIRSVVKGKQPRPPATPKCVLSGKGCGVA